ncbi:MAG: hypothetical protein GWP39_04225 [Planctomycetia bacterium]|nr:hypothetical protein [Planctomycetia bacterium]NCG12751.1 hypothetical protein [Planctomycetia bacterium]NCG55881.1 hypothetical protein [Pseudomonadota bacterium]
MRKDLSLIRRLEKIEKELGYCQIKLEKEHRLATRVHFLRAHRDQMREALTSYPETDSNSHNSLGGIAFLEISRRMMEDESSFSYEDIRLSFIALGMRPEIGQELELLDTDISDTTEKLSTFRVFHDKIAGLQSERAQALSSFILEEGEPVLEISENFEATESRWNVLTEDLTNLDDALFCVQRANDYLSSARNFVLQARSHYSVQQWLESGYLVDLFKHSLIGRIKEMLEGAERNLKTALGELICLNDEDYDLFEFSDFAPILLPFYKQLFGDVFKQTKFQDVLSLVEERLDRSERLHKRLEEARENVFSSQMEQESARENLFHQIGEERRKLRLSN